MFNESLRGAFSPHPFSVAKTERWIREHVASDPGLLFGGQHTLLSKTPPTPLGFQGV
jgi:hypothetical protein